MKVERTTGSHTLTVQRDGSMSRAGVGGEDERREQDLVKDKTVHDRCVSELVRSGQAVEI